MTPLPLDEIIGLRWRHHLSALWWLGLLYRRPQRFLAALQALPRHRQIGIGCCLLGHAWPWILLFGVFNQFPLIVSGLGEGREDFISIILVHVIIYRIDPGILIGLFAGFAFLIPNHFSGRPFEIPFWITSGIAFGIAFGCTAGLHFGIGAGTGISDLSVFGIAVGIAAGIVNRIASGRVFGIANGIAFGSILGIAAGVNMIADGTVFETSEDIGFEVIRGIVLGIAGGIVGVIASVITILRLYYLLPHFFFLWPKPQGDWYRHHPVAWDDLCSVPFPGLDRLLLAYADSAPAAAEREIERLIESYPSQRFQALKAKAALIARRAGREPDLTRLDRIAAALPRGSQGFLNEVPDLCEMIGGLAALQRHLDTINRPLFREPHAALLKEMITNFHSQVAGFTEPLGTEFRAAAVQWQKIADQQWRAARAVVDKQPSPQVFRAGDPADRSQEGFLLRERVVGELEAQLTLATGCPGLVLYGRRRTGKSTLLRNLDGFLPQTVTVATLSMQNPRAFTSLESFAGLIAETIAGALPEAPQPSEPPATLAALFALWGSVNHWLLDRNRRLLLAIDEYEFLDTKITDGVLPVDLLAMVRESIQTHRRLIWLFAGSHHMTELKHSAWTSAFVSVRTLDMPLFELSETRLLLTEPLRHSPLWPKNDPLRPRFAPEFWGDHGIERLHTEAGGWPHLVQLLAETAVNLVNDTDARGLNPVLFERTLNKATESGDIVLRQLLERECVLDGEWHYLSGFRASETQPPPEDPAVSRALRRRLMVVEDGDRWRLRVPLMRRWLCQRD